MVVVTPDPNVQHHPGGGPVTFTFTRTISSGDDGSCTTLWSTGDTGSTTTFGVTAPAGDEIDGTVSVTITRHSDGATAGDSADWVADGF